MAGQTSAACGCSFLNVTQGAATGKIGRCTHFRLGNSEALTDDFVLVGSKHVRTTKNETETQSHKGYRLVEVCVKSLPQLFPCFRSWKLRLGSAKLDCGVIPLLHWGPKHDLPPTGLYSDLGPARMCFSLRNQHVQEPEGAETENRCRTLLKPTTTTCLVIESPSNRIPNTNSACRTADKSLPAKIGNVSVGGGKDVNRRYRLDGKRRCLSVRFCSGESDNAASKGYGCE